LFLLARRVFDGFNDDLTIAVGTDIDFTAHTAKAVAA
jgi:hypothetical protein